MSNLLNLRSEYLRRADFEFVFQLAHLSHLLNYNLTKDEKRGVNRSIKALYDRLDVAKNDYEQKCTSKNSSPLQRVIEISNLIQEDIENALDI